MRSPDYCSRCFHEGRALAECEHDESTHTGAEPEKSVLITWGAIGVLIVVAGLLALFGVALLNPQ